MKNTGYDHHNTLIAKRASGYLKTSDGYSNAPYLDMSIPTVEALKKLENPPVTVDAKTFDAYVGEYELAPGFILSVFREGEKLMTQATGQPKFEIFAESETTFAPRAFPAKLTFVKDSEGKVTAVLLNQGGREVNGKKIK